MGLESATFISDLDSSNPVSSDKRKQGDDHLRLIKSAAKATFPNASKAFYFPGSQAKTGNYTVVAADMSDFLTGDATGGAFNFTLPTLVAADAGWAVHIQKIDSSVNAVTVVGTINGATNFVISSQYDGGAFYWSGTAWQAFPFFSTSSTVVGFSREITEVEAGAAAGPVFSLFRDSASPAVSDLLGALELYGRSSTAVKRLYGRIISQIVDPVNATEDGNLLLQTIVAGALTTIATLKATGVDVVGLLTASAGLRATTGGLTVDAGGATITAGGLTVSAGSVSVPAGSIAAAALATPPGFVKLQSQVAAGSATIDFVHGVGGTVLDDTYDAYVLVGTSFQPATDSAGFWMRVGTGGGPTYQADAADYRLSSTTAAQIEWRSADATDGMSNAAGEVGNCVIRFANPEVAELHQFTCEGAFRRAGTAANNSFTVSRASYETAEAITAIRLLMSSGNIAIGRFTLYGLTK